MTSCIANEMEDREYRPLSPEGILFLTTAKTLKTEKNKKWSWRWSRLRADQRADRVRARSNVM